MATREVPLAPVWLRWVACAVLLALAVVEVVTTGSPWAWALLALPVACVAYMLRGSGRH